MNNKIERKSYSPPRIECVSLDNEISLELQSEPPTYEHIKLSNAPEYFNNNPFNSSVG